MAKYIQHSPKPLLDDLVGGRWLPMVGAGLSRNAVVPKGEKMPLWGDLADALTLELEDYIRQIHWTRSQLTNTNSVAPSWSNACRNCCW